MKFIVGCVILCFLQPSYADVSRLFGIGKSAYTSGVSSVESSPYASELHPATMSLLDTGWTWGWGVLGVSENFQSLSNVVIDNPELGASEVIRGYVNTDIDDVFLYTLGVNYKLRNSIWNWAFGFNVNVSSGSLIRSETKDVYRPQFALYHSDMQRTTASLSIAVMPLKRVALGFGMTTYFLMEADVRSRLPSVRANQTASMNLGVDVKTRFAPLFSLVWSLSEKDWLSFLYLGKRDYGMNMRVQSDLHLIGGSAPIVFNGVSQLFFDPSIYAIQYERKINVFRLMTELEYQDWQETRGNVVYLSFDTFKQSFEQSFVPIKYKGVWKAAIAGTWEMNDRWDMHLGYGYLPSPVPKSGGKLNFMDANRHILSWGAEYRLGSLNGFLVDSKAFLSFGAQAHFLEKTSVKKKRATDIGAPGYDIRGSIINYSLNMRIQ